MDKMIGYCGLDCGKCEARTATLNNDNELRKKVAKLWSELNNADITPEMINCEGCRADGVKTPYCESMCQIRQCAMKNGHETCGACPDMEACETVGKIISNSPEAKSNMKK